MGAVSLDGRYLTATDWKTGDLSIRDLATGEMRHVTSNKSIADGDAEYRGKEHRRPGEKERLRESLANVPDDRALGDVGIPKVTTQDAAGVERKLF